MGTSASSNGPGGDVLFDPPWLDEIDHPSDNDLLQDEAMGSNEEDSATLRPTIAPAKRFLGARRSLNHYVRTGDKESLSRALGHYSKTGMGGARNVADRMRTSTRAASSLFNFLQTAREGTDESLNEWISSLTTSNADTDEVINEIINKVSPDGGSIDETACGESMAQAIASVLEREPSINLFNLEDDNVWELIELFISFEAFKRICLDIGKIFEDSAISARTRVTRMNEMQEYLKAEIIVQIEELRNANEDFAPTALQKILKDAVESTFIVYEEVL